MKLFPEKLAGWGHVENVPCQVAYPASREDLQDLVKNKNNQFLAGFGRGRSYGDAATNRDQVVVKFDELDKVLEFDREKGIIKVEAGITLEDIIDVILPYGWFIPTTPGTKYPTLGGCFASDVHGKGHHVDGTISRHIIDFEIVLADGSVKKCSKTKNKTLFWATAGGMGLTGFIYSLTMKLMKVETAYLHVLYKRAKNLRQLMDLIEQYDKEQGDKYPYSVSWVDGMASGKSLGRGKVMLGRNATAEELPVEFSGNPLWEAEGLQGSMPIRPPFSFVNPTTTKIFNEMNWRRGGPENEKYVYESLSTFYYPLDVARKWFNLYGSKGFIQYQYVVPDESAYDLTYEVLKFCQQEGHISSLIVLKRMGEKAGLLSFPFKGWTLAMDIAVRPGLWEALEKIDEMVVKYNGRVYLTKDIRLKPETFRTMYPEFPEWLKIKRKYDPENRFSSDLSRRLRMSEEI